MDSQAELLLQTVCQLGGVQGRLGLECLFESVDHLFGELVRPHRAWSLGKQAGQPRRVKDRLGLLEGRP